MNTVHRVFVEIPYTSELYKLYEQLDQRAAIFIRLFYGENKHHLLPCEKHKNYDKSVSLEFHCPVVFFNQEYGLRFCLYFVGDVVFSASLIETIEEKDYEDLLPAPLVKKMQKEGKHFLIQSAPSADISSVFIISTL